MPRVSDVTDSLQNCTQHYSSPKHCNALYKMSPKRPDSCRRCRVLLSFAVAIFFFVQNHTTTTSTTTANITKSNTFIRIAAGTTTTTTACTTYVATRRAMTYIAMRRTTLFLYFVCLLLFCYFLIRRRVFRSECSHIVLQQIMLCECITQNKHT